MNYPGFVYNQKKHSYFLDNREMTGVTTVLRSAGDTSGLIQWAANLATAEALQIFPFMKQDRLQDLIEKVNSYPKIDTNACREIDKLFPEFKEIRTTHAKVRDTAGDVGKEAHHLCELFELGETYSVSAEVGLRAKPYFEWYKQNIEKTYFVEKPLFSRSMFLGGTPDGGFLTRDGKNLINDKKFKNYLFSPHAMWQMAAYTEMLKEMAQDTETPIRLELANDKVEEYANSKEYLGSLGTIEWNGSVVILLDPSGRVKPIYRYNQEQDLETFKAALRIYREIAAFQVLKNETNYNKTI